MAFASVSMFGNPAYVKSNVIKHAMGDQGADNVRPVCLTVASELAMALVGEGNAMGGYYLVSLTEIRNLPLSDMGKSWQKDYAIYPQAKGAYPQYRLGLAKLYGLGTQQDVNAGLKQLEQAYEQGSVQAAEALILQPSPLRG